MATTGTQTFNLNLNELIEEAFERAGSELRSGYDFRTARRSLNLLTIEWANRGLNLWTIEEATIPLTPNTFRYNLPTDIIDVLDMAIRKGSGSAQSDINLQRISASNYLNIPNKNHTGRPIQAWIDRKVATPQINFWPVPDTNDYIFVYHYLRRMDDAGNGVNTQDIPFRFLPCLVAGLAYYIAMKLPEAVERVPGLKQIYDEQWMLASSEDREKAPLRIVPRIGHI